MQRVFLLAVCCACLPGVGGCVIPYAFPKLDYTRALQLDTPATAHVFRVDTAQTTAPSPICVTERLSKISVAEDGKVAAQFKPSFRNGIYLFMGALNFDFGKGKLLSLRAYRPGFELVEIESMEQVEHITWTPAKDFAAQEKALDSLMPHEEQDSGVRQEAGSRSAAHGEALRFGAAEYERLAAIAEQPVERARLQAKAGRLRARALE